MMTLIARLCVLCAMSALMQMILQETRARASLRMICGLLMLRLTVERLLEIGGQLRGQTDLMGVFECLMR